MNFTATFIFHSSLNDFLPASKKLAPIIYTFNNNPAIKDCIEAIGIPHTEVSEIIVDNASVDFYYKLRDGASVEVYPFSAGQMLEDFYKEHLASSVKFICDVQLGTLAKSLRLIGFDTAYQNNYTPKTIVKAAVNEARIILTRNVSLLKRKEIKYGYWIRSQQLETQLKEIIQRFNLSSQFKAFTRCLQCNNDILPVDKEVIIDKLPPKTILYFNEFYQCAHCRKIHWKGSHYDKMLMFVEQANVS